MRKLSFLIALCTLLTVGGVYATWTYMETNNVADETIHMAVNLGNVEFAGSYGTYVVNADNVKMTIDPAEGTTHNTALYVTGELVITFTTNINAPDAIKQNGVDSTFQFSLGTGTWEYEGQQILTIPHSEAHAFEWESRTEENGIVTFTYTMSAEELAAHFELANILLDTHAKYLTYNAALGQIDVVVSDGIVTNGQ